MSVRGHDVVDQRRAAWPWGSSCRRRRSPDTRAPSSRKRKPRPSCERGDHGGLAGPGAGRAAAGMKPTPIPCPLPWRAAPPPAGSSAVGAHEPRPARISSVLPACRCPQHATVSPLLTARSVPEDDHGFRWLLHTRSSDRRGDARLGVRRHSRISWGRSARQSLGFPCVSRRARPAFRPPSTALTCPIRCPHPADATARLVARGFPGVSGHCHRSRHGFGDGNSARPNRRRPSRRTEEATAPVAGRQRHALSRRDSWTSNERDQVVEFDPVARHQGKTTDRGHGLPATAGRKTPPSSSVSQWKRPGSARRLPQSSTGGTSMLAAGRL